MRTGNPALNDKVFTTGFAPAADRMSVQGTVVKALLLLLLVLLSAAWIWGRFYSGVSGVIEPIQLERNLADIYPWMIRSEERRVGKEGRSPWSALHLAR